MLMNILSRMDNQYCDNMNYRGTSSPFSLTSLDSRDSSSNGSAMSASMSPLSTNLSSPESVQYSVSEMDLNLNECINVPYASVPFIQDTVDLMQFRSHNDEPYLEIMEQPVDKFRFRYRSEMMGTHGSLMGKNSEKGKKIYPTVQLKNYTGEAIIRCSLYQVNHHNRSPHTHQLVLRHAGNNQESCDPHDIHVNVTTGYTAVFAGMGIIHTAKKNIEDILVNKVGAEYERRNMKLSKITLQEIKEKAKQDARTMNLNSVCLCFEALDPHTMSPICEKVFSTPINNMKSALTGELKIVRLSKNTSSCTGGDEVFMFVEKVGKKNIKVRFYELDDNDQEIWQAYGMFSELDVHHQYAIALRTPAYHDTNIESSVSVFIQLYRPSDGDVSEPMKFTYKPSARISNSERKRARTESLYDSFELRASLPTVINDSAYVVPIDQSYQSGESFSSLSNIELQSTDEMNSEEFKNFLETIKDDIGLNLEATGAVRYDYGMENLQFYEACKVPDRQLRVDGAMSPDSERPRKQLTKPEIDDDNRIEPQMEYTPDQRAVCSEADDLIIDTRKVEKNKFLNRNCFKVIQPANSTKVSRKILDIDLNDFMDVQPECCAEPEIVKTNRSPRVVAVAPEFAPVVTIRQRLMKFLKEAKRYGTKNPHGNNNRKEIEVLYLNGIDGNTILHDAVEKDQMSVARETLSVLVEYDMCALVNKKNAHGKTVLHTAVEHGRYTYIKPLLAAGINPNLTDNEGHTPLHLAIMLSNITAFNQLMNGANYMSPKSEKLNINQTTNDGSTALHLAADRGLKEVVQKIMTSEININAVEFLLGNSALHIAVDRNHEDIVKVLLRSADINVNIFNRQGHTPLHLACVVDTGSVKGSVRIVQMLLEAKADPSLTCIYPNKDDVKQEPCSDDDSDTETVEEGHTSYELAKSNPEILQLLTAYAVDDGNPYYLTPKVELMDSADIEVRPDLSMLVKTEYCQQILFDDECSKKLCDYLDKSGNWEKLAELLDYNSFLGLMRASDSPTKVLLSHIENAETNLQNIIDLLRALDEDEAVEAIDSMLAKQSSH